MITFLIPTFREKDNINLIVSNIDKLKISYHYNIYFVDDNSNDGSIDIFNELSKNYNNIRYHIRKNNKRDLTKSILEGLENINSDYVFILDCDFQHELEKIPEMINIIIKQEFDLVIGKRDLNDIKSYLRRSFSKLGVKFAYFSGIKRIEDPLSGFFIIKTVLFKSLSKKITTSGFKVLISIIFYLKKNSQIYEIPIDFKKRQFGFSKFSLKVIFLFVIQILYLKYQDIKNNVINQQNYK